MTLFVFGLSHKTAALALREKIAVADSDAPAVLNDLKKASGAHELALLSTCNRTEFHGVADPAEPVVERLRAWAAQRLGRELETATETPFYLAREADALRHLIRVSSGLDSMVLGEPQIFGQIKNAYARAVECNTAHSELHRVFNHVFSASKRVRNDTAIGANPVSVASAAVRLSRRVFSSLEDSHVLLIGAGQTIAIAARHLQKERVATMHIANRTVERGEALAQELGAEAIALAGVPSVLQHADIVITSTASQLPVIGKGMVEQALKARKNRPMFIVDIAVPRDVEEQVGEMDNVYLYTIDDLQGIVDSNLKEREAELGHAHSIIEESIDEFSRAAAERQAVDHVKAYRSGAASIRDQELQRALSLLKAGKSPEDALQNLANSLTNKLIHAPSVAIKEASAANESLKLEWAEQLLDIRVSLDANKTGSKD